jgi:exosortase
MHRTEEVDAPPPFAPASSAPRSWIAPARRVPRDLWIAWGITAAAFFPIFGPWVRDWQTDPNYSQGFLIPIISVFLAARALRQGEREGAGTVAAGTAVQGFSWVGVVLVLFGLMAYLLGTGGSESFTTRTGFVLTWLGAVWWIAGAGLGRLLTVPILFLLFSVPIPSVIYFNIAVPLQNIAARVASGVLHGVGVPLTRDGNTLLLPGATLEVADACSGIRSLTVLLALGALWAYLEKGKPLRRALLFAGTVPLAVLGNAVRVTLTALGVYLLGPWIAEGAAHEATGLVVFAVTLAGLYLLSKILRTSE